MTDISHLVVNGCSFTYGAELEDPVNEAWPAHVAKNLGIPVVNIACGSIGNDAIHRRTYEYFYEDLKNDNNPLYIIGFSAFVRKEYWHEAEKFYRGIHIADRRIPDMNLAQREFLENYSLEDLYRRTLLFKLSLKNLFVSYNIPHLFVDMMDISENNIAEDIGINKLLSLYNQVKHDPNNIGKIYNKLENPTFCTHGHLDAQTNLQVGNVITSALHEKYQLKIIHDKKFLSANEYSLKLEPEKLQGYWRQHYGAWK